MIFFAMCTVMSIFQFKDLSVVYSSLRSDTPLAEGDWTDGDVRNSINQTF